MLRRMFAKHIRGPGSIFTKVFPLGLAMTLGGWTCFDEETETWKDWRFLQRFEMQGECMLSLHTRFYHMFSSRGHTKPPGLSSSVSEKKKKCLTPFGSFEVGGRRPRVTYSMKILHHSETFLADLHIEEAADSNGMILPKINCVEWLHRMRVSWHMYMLCMYTPLYVHIFWNPIH